MLRTRSAGRIRDTIDVAVPVVLIYLTILEDRRYTRIYPWIVPLQLLCTWIGRRSLGLGLKAKPGLAIRFPLLDRLNVSSHEQGGCHDNSLRGWCRAAPRGVVEGVLMSATVFGLTTFDTCRTLAILSFSVPIGSEFLSSGSLFFCSCAILSAAQIPTTSWYTAGTISVFGIVIFIAVSVNRRLACNTGSRQEQSGRAFRLSVFSGFVGTEKELVIAFATAVLLLLLQFPFSLGAPTWSGLGFLAAISVLSALSSMAVDLAAKDGDRADSPSFAPFIIIAITLGYFAREPAADKRWAYLTLAFGLAMVVLDKEEHQSRDYNGLAGIDDTDTLKEEGSIPLSPPGNAPISSGAEIGQSSDKQLRPLSKRPGLAALIALPIVLALIQEATELHRLDHLGFPSTANDPMRSVRNSAWTAHSDYDLVISYYDEDLDLIRGTIEQVKKRLPRGTSSKTIVYAKGPNSVSRAAMDEFLQQIDAEEIVALKNVGREGETYLQHIVRHYSSADSPLATQTIFLQPHIPWPDTAFPRLESMTTTTGFMSLSTYANASCPSDGSEIDMLDQVHPRIAQIYSSFQQDLCPPTGFTITWFGQFVVSRRRIHQNPLKAYQNLLRYFDVPVGQGNAKDWIWDEGWWNNTPDNPTLGHALERSWPAIFGCSDLKLALDCKDESGSHCMCMD